MHEKVVPDVQQLARDDASGKLTKRHLYNISKVPEREQRKVAERIQRDGLTAVETERLTATPRSRSRKSCGIAARQRRFHTETADVVITFRSAKHNDAAVLQVLDSLRGAIHAAEE